MSAFDPASRLVEWEESCFCCGSQSHCPCFGTACPTCGGCHAHCDPTAPECQNKAKVSFDPLNPDDSGPFVDRKEAV